MKPAHLLDEQSRSIAIVIVNYRTPELVADCLKTILVERDSLPELTVMVVDGGSGDGSAEKIEASLNDPVFANWVTFLPLDINGGFGWANNQAILRLLRQENPPAFIHLLNPDSRIEPGAIAALRDAMIAHPRCAVAGSQLINPDLSLAGSAFRFPTAARELVSGARIHRVGVLLGIAPTLIQSERIVPADWVTGASCMVRTAALAETGLFDHGFFLYFEEVELMYRLKRAGWDILHVPDSRVIHIGGAATGVRDGKSVAAPTKPDYWFRSRRRFHALAYGRRMTAIAGVAWLVGDMFWRLRTILKLSSRSETDLAERRSLLRAGILADADDIRPQIATAKDALDQRPAWMPPN
ncbi:glycosyltransferase family 2 protein [Sphingobium boeckii]|uniref:Glycosyltransferase family 2 protein n=1 Tax=Sphingobium boeckii TaxID=1082345 RepID=A0A7W9AJ50_9SPHN|nr:glycosyltransferase family 2 protein [Sphingobium boeckii]MBB5686633.1 hypothetical protein [Sphingobium boeckii]